MLNKSKIIEKLVPSALAVQEYFNIRASICTAQVILETGWLRHCSGNNLFGIKWTPRCGYESNEIRTHEWIDGVRTPQICLFRKYKDYGESFKDYAELLTSLNRYKPVISAPDYKSACYELYRCGYCTDPNYTKKLINIIEENKLYKYDNVSTVEEDNSVNPILALQINLNKLCITDYDNCALVEDGILGPRTKSSMDKFSEICGLNYKSYTEEDILKFTAIVLSYISYSNRS